MATRAHHRRVTTLGFLHRAYFRAEARDIARLLYSRTSWKRLKSSTVPRISRASTRRRVVAADHAAARQLRSAAAAPWWRGRRAAKVLPVAALRIEHLPQAPQRLARRHCRRSMGWGVQIGATDLARTSRRRSKRGCGSTKASLPACWCRSAGRDIASQRLARGGRNRARRCSDGLGEPRSFKASSRSMRALAGIG